MIEPIHTKVKGRGRFKVACLYRNGSIKRGLEERLATQRDILDVSASTVTGNVLVLFNSGKSHEDIACMIECVLSELEVGVYDAGLEADSEKPPGAKDATKTQRTSIQDKVTWFLSSRKMQEEETWHCLKREQVLELLATSGERGLSHDEASNRLKKFGLNNFPQSDFRSKFDVFKDQFISLPVGLLGAAAAISLVTGGALDAIVIMGVIIANAVIGFFTESEAEKTIQSLKKFVRPQVKVIRNGAMLQIPGEEAVQGDIIVFKPGTYVAADSRVIYSSRLSIDESVLTGESMPVSKRANVLTLPGKAIADRVNMVYMGTLVTGGEGLAVVVATGGATEIGKLHKMLQKTTSPETPIERQLRITGDHLVLLCGAICGAVFVIGFLRGYGFIPMLRMAISLAAAAVPEGLPAAATINFALGIKKMRKHHVLIRHLQAVETLGAIHTLCLDKTGTLTTNRMAVLRIYVGRSLYELKNGEVLENGKPVDPTINEDFVRLLTACVLCNESQINGKDENGQYRLGGSPTEQALIRMAFDAGLDVKRVRSENRLLKINYRAENRLFMSTLHERSDSKMFFSLKGSPSEVLSLCSWKFKDGKILPIEDEDRNVIQKHNEQMAGEALRVLAVAYCITAERNAPDDNNLTWLGLVGMKDPIREGLDDLIKVFHRAGIDTVMITGDQNPTAYAVARQLNLCGDDRLKILDSTALDQLDADLLKALSKEVNVYSRVSPSHKLKIVQALQSSGRTVAMTGDGINDGPALKAADIGIAMGRDGTDVARDVADIILERDDLETLAIAIKFGRSTYSNIRKSVHFFLATNLSEIMVMFFAMAAGIGVPLTVMQLLWINIMSDIFPGLALSLEAPEPDVLNRPPRETDAPLFSFRDYKNMAVESSVITAGALSAYGYGLARYGLGSKAVSIAFQSLTIGQLLHAFSCRSDNHSAFHPGELPPNNTLSLAVGSSILLQLLTMIAPNLRRFLGIATMNIFDLAVVGVSSLAPVAVNEARKLSKSGDVK